jgi:hypothetical protein
MNSRNEFTGIERLDPVVDSADPKPFDLIGNLVIGQLPPEGGRNVCHSCSLHVT